MRHDCPGYSGHAPKRWHPAASSSGRRHDAHSRTSLRASSSDDGITGSSLSEIAALDQLIDLLKGANGQEALTRLVAENLLAFDRQFWIRLATRSDGAQSSAEREQLTNLANVWGSLAADPCLVYMIVASMQLCHPLFGRSAGSILHCITLPACSIPMPLHCTY